MLSDWLSVEAEKIRDFPIERGENMESVQTDS